MLNNAGHIDAKFIDFSNICQKKSSEIGCFLLIVSWRSLPPKFPVKSADFSANLPFENPLKFDFFPLNSGKIGWFFCESWLFSCENPAKSAYFFWRISTFFPHENPSKSTNFFSNLPLKIPRNFAFFSAKYQKPCDEKQRQLQFIQKQILAASFTSSLSFWKTLSVRQSSIM